jgi:hypothetical protein
LGSKESTALVQLAPKVEKGPERMAQLILTVLNKQV